MVCPLRVDRELFFDGAEQKVTLPRANADRLAILSSNDKNNLLDTSEKVHPRFSKLTNAVNSANHNVPHVGYVGSDSSSMFTRPPKPLFLLNRHLII